MRPLAALALLLAGCVVDAVVARPPDAGALADATPGSRDPVLRIVMTATGEDNATDRSEFAVTVEVFATRDGVPTDAALVLARERGEVALRATGPGHYVAGLDEYPAALAITLSSDDGARLNAALALPRPFTFDSPRLHEHVAIGSPVYVEWSPSGGSVATLLAPGGPRSIDDSGRLTLVPGAFPGPGERVIRLQRSTTAPTGSLPAGSTFTVTVVNSIEIDLG